MQRRGPSCHTLVYSFADADDEAAQRDQSQEMVLDKRNFLGQLLLRQRVCRRATETRQLDLILQRVNASLRQIKIEMVEIFVQDTRPVRANGQVTNVRRRIKMATLDEDSAIEGRSDGAAPEVDVSAVGVVVRRLQQQDLHVL